MLLGEGNNGGEGAGGKAGEIIEVGSVVWSDLMGYESGRFDGMD